MNPMIILNGAMLIVKALRGKNVKEDVDGDRPVWLGRRVLGTVIVALTALAGMAGVTVPPEAMAQVMDNGEQIFVLIKDNAGLWTAVWGGLLAIWGSIQAGK